MAPKDITSADLTDVLEYDPVTGHFTWVGEKSYPRMRGKRAGVLQPNGYRNIQIDGARYHEHKLAFIYMHGSAPSLPIDHKNGIKSDNRWENLRAVKHADNMHNQRRPHKNNRSGFLGVVIRPNSSRFWSKIRVGNKNIHLGVFDTAEEAHSAYIKAKMAMHSGYLPGMV